MPVTPRFSLSQDDEFVHLSIVVPHVRVSAAEVDVDGARVAFFCAPYLLRLTLPGALVDDARCRAEYDADAAGGTLNVRVAKAQAGEHFEGLDMVTRLLQPPDGDVEIDEASGAMIRETRVDTEGRASAREIRSEP